MMMGIGGEGGQGVAAAAEAEQGQVGGEYIRETRPG